MTVQTYNPKDVDVLVGGKLLSGFGKSKVTVRRESDAWNDEIGADGDVLRWATNDKRGEIEIQLLQSSASNLYLSGLAKADELTGTGIIPVIVKDNRGKDLHAAPTAWIKQIPEAAYIDGASFRVWLIRTDHLTNLLGGA